MKRKHHSGKHTDENGHAQGPVADELHLLDEQAEAKGPAAVPDRTLEIPMRLLSRTVKQTRDGLAQLAVGQVLAVHTDDP